MLADMYIRCVIMYHPPSEYHMKTFNVKCLGIVQVFLCCHSPHHLTHTGQCCSVVNRDNVEWTEEQEASAKKKVLENSQPLPSEKQGCIIVVKTHVSYT